MWCWSTHPINILKHFVYKMNVIWDTILAITEEEICINASAVNYALDTLVVQQQQQQQQHALQIL